MNYLVNYLPSLVAAVIAILSVFNAQIQDLIMTHPAIATVLGALYAILAHLLPQPQK